MRIAVMGAGGVGGYFGGLLAMAGEDIWFIARGAHLRAMQRTGLTVKSVAGDFAVPVQAAADPREAESIDLILFCVKTYDTDEASNPSSPRSTKERSSYPSRTASRAQRKSAVDSEPTGSSAVSPTLSPSSPLRASSSNGARFEESNWGS